MRFALSLGLKSIRRIGTCSSAYLNRHVIEQTIFPRKSTQGAPQAVFSPYLSGGSLDWLKQPSPIFYLTI